jgi:hypothetical protein
MSRFRSIGLGGTNLIDWSSFNPYGREDKIEIAGEEKAIPKAIVEGFPFPKWEDPTSHVTWDTGKGTLGSKYHHGRNFASGSLFIRYNAVHGRHSQTKRDPGFS